MASLSLSSSNISFSLANDRSFELTSFSTDPKTEALIKTIGQGRLEAYIKSIWKSTEVEHETIEKLKAFLSLFPDAIKVRFNGITKIQDHGTRSELTKKCSTINSLHLACFSLKKDLAVYLHEQDPTLIRTGTDSPSLGHTPLAYLATERDPLATEIFQNLLTTVPFPLSYSTVIPNPSPIHEIAHAGNHAMMNIVFEQLSKPYKKSINTELNTLPNVICSLVIDYFSNWSCPEAQLAVDLLTDSALGLPASTPLRLAVKNGNFLADASRMNLVILLLKAGAHPLREIEVQKKFNISHEGDPSKNEILYMSKTLSVIKAELVDLIPYLNGSSSGILKESDIRPVPKRAQQLMVLTQEHSPHYQPPSPAKTA